MRKTLLASASAVALTCAAAHPAHAAAPVYNWSGFYFGGNVGGGAGNSDPSWIANIFAAPFSLTGVETNPHLQVQGFAGGGQAGYNFQTGNYVYGFETDFTGMSVRGSTTMSPFFMGKGGGNTVTWTSKYSWLYTARLRGGITFDGNVLVYGTGGLAIVNVRDTATCTAPTDGCAGGIGPFGPQLIEWSKSSTLTGGVAGGGIEVMPFANWIAGVKVLHMFLPSTTPGVTSANTTFGAGPVPSAFSFNHNLTIITFEVSYKFGGP